MLNNFIIKNDISIGGNIVHSNTEARGYVKFYHTLRDSIDNPREVLFVLYVSELSNYARVRKNSIEFYMRNEDLYRVCMINEGSNKTLLGLKKKFKDNGLIIESGLKKVNGNNNPYMFYVLNDYMFNAILNPDLPLDSIKAFCDVILKDVLTQETRDKMYQYAVDFRASKTKTDPCKNYTIANDVKNTQDYIYNKTKDFLNNSLTENSLKKLNKTNTYSGAIFSKSLDRSASTAVCDKKDSLSLDSLIDNINKLNDTDKQKLIKALGLQAKQETTMERPTSTNKSTLEVSQDDINAPAQKNQHEHSNQKSILSHLKSKITAKNTKGNTSSAVELLNGFKSDFEAFWKIYPRKVGKQEALKAYIKARNGYRTNIGDFKGVDKDVLFNALKRFVESIDKKTEMRFIPHLTTWLNQRRYEDCEEVKQKEFNSGELIVDYDKLPDSVKKIMQESPILDLNARFLLQNGGIKKKSIEFMFSTCKHWIESAIKRGNKPNIYIYLDKGQEEAFDKFLAENGILKENLSH